MNDSSLHFQLLEAPLIIKNYVAGDAACNYEIYLTEIINASSWLSSAFPATFCAPSSESHGECDVYSGEYGLDFKIIASKTAMQARSIYSFQIIKMADGAYRVLLTRSRQGMIIYVPEGNPKDPTTVPELYDSTFEYLRSLGLQVI